MQSHPIPVSVLSPVPDSTVLSKININSLCAWFVRNILENMCKGAVKKKKKKKKEEEKRITCEN